MRASLQDLASPPAIEGSPRHQREAIREATADDVDAPDHPTGLIEQGRRSRLLYARVGIQKEWTPGLLWQEPGDSYRANLVLRDDRVPSAFLLGPERLRGVEAPLIISFFYLTGEVPTVVEAFFASLDAFNLPTAPSTKISEALTSGVPTFSLPDLDIEPEAVQRVPLTLALRHCVMPFRIEGDRLFVVMEDPGNFIVIEDLARLTGLKIEVFAASEVADIHTAIVANYLSARELEVGIRVQPSLLGPPRLSVVDPDEVAFVSYLKAKGFHYVRVKEV
ncbi:MAG: hypothetical protein HY073_05280 [Deltaproteobacteria bacterium]|nr:hypothetical protein [Deltaproteobacteria bacterium]